jgi:hypothetical protein
MDYLQHQYLYSSLLQVLQLNIVLLVSKPSSSILITFRYSMFSSQYLYYIPNGCLNVIYEICKSAILSLFVISQITQKISVVL